MANEKRGYEGQKFRVNEVGEILVCPGEGDGCFEGWKVELGAVFEHLALVHGKILEFRTRWMLQH